MRALPVSRVRAAPVPAAWAVVHAHGPRPTRPTPTLARPGSRMPLCCSCSCRPKPALVRPAADERRASHGYQVDGFDAGQHEIAVGPPPHTPRPDVFTCGAASIDAPSYASRRRPTVSFGRELGDSTGDRNRQVTSAAIRRRPSGTHQHGLGDTGVPLSRRSAKE